MTLEEGIGVTGTVAPTYVLIIFLQIIYVFHMFVVKKDVPSIYARLSILLTGVAIGLMSHYVPYLQDYTKEILKVNPWFLLAFYFVFHTFRVMFSLDMPMMFRSWAQVLLLSTLGFILRAVIVGCIVMYAVNNFSFNFLTALTYGAIVTRSTPFELKMVLDNYPHLKHLETLVSSEGVLSEAILIIIFNVTFQLQTKDANGLQTFVYLIRLVGGGIVTGLILGLLFQQTIKLFESDIGMLMFINLSWSLASYHIAEELMFCGSLTLVIIGIFSLIEKESAGVDSGLMNSNFWKIMINIARFINTTFFGIIVGEKFLTKITKAELIVVMVTIFTIYLARFIFTMLMTPLLSRTGLKLTLREGMIISLCVSSGGCSYFLALILLTHENKMMVEIGRQLCIVECFVNVLTSVSSIFLTPWLLKALGLTTISLARRKNMNTCLKYIKMKTDNFVATLKMDKFLGDAKWTVVNEICTIRNPYNSKQENTDIYEEKNDFQLVLTQECPNCSKTLYKKPTVKELADMTWESRKRVLKAKKVSYQNQYENDLLSRGAFRSLTNSVETALDTVGAIIQLDDLNKMFTIKKNTKPKRNKLQQLLMNIQKEHKIPMNPIRRICYKMIMHPAFDLTICLIVIINSILILIMLIKAKRFWGKWIAVICIRFICDLIFIAEFVIKILGYSTKSICRDGFRTYFRSFWNIFDFGTLVVIILSVMLTSCKMLSPCYYIDMSTLKVIHCIVLSKILVILKYTDFVIRKIITFKEYRSNQRILRAYEIAKGYILGDEGIEELMMKTVDNKSIRDDCKGRIVADRLALTKKLGIVQKEKPWIANRVKTKHACFAVMNSTKSALGELKVTGWIDEIEFNILQKALNIQKKFIKNMHWIPINSPKEMFKEISWINNNSEICEFLFEQIIVKIFETGDQIFIESILPDGVVIIVSGLVRLSYIPKSNIIRNNNTYGYIPIVDYIGDVSYTESYQEYILAGNSFGELSVLTGRPSDCNIYAETPVHAFILKRDVFLTGFEVFPDIILGLESQMWKTVGMRISPLILTYIPFYENFSLRELMYYIAESSVPNIKYFKIINIANTIEDVVMLEGIAQDYYSKEYFYAPCYIPRTIQKLILPKSSKFELDNMVNTKLMIIPVKNVNMGDLVAEIYATSVVMENVSKLSLAYLTQAKINFLRKKKQAVSVYARKITIKDDDTSLRSKQTLYRFSSTNLHSTTNFSDLDFVEKDDDKSSKES